jgi:hypothetical protein
MLMVAALLAWASVVSALHLGFARAPGGAATIDTLTYAVPVALAAVALLRRTEAPSLAFLAGAAWAVTLAVTLPPDISRDPKLALAIPAAALGGVVAHRFPTMTLSLMFLMAGTYGSLQAFTGVPGDSVMDKLIDTSWVGVLGALLIGRRTVRVRPTPALFMLGGFLLVCVLDVFATAPIGSGIRALRLAPLFLSVVLLVGYGGFSRRTLDVLARVMVVICLVVAAYAALRWAIGTSGKERALQRTALDRQYNKLAFTSDTKVQGSLPNGVLLGLWMACTIPLLVAAAMGWRGIFRVIAVVALPLSVIGLLGSAQRAGLAGAAAGGVTILVVHLLSRGSRGPRLGIAVTAVLFLLVSATVVYPKVLDNPEKQKRYENLLTPSQDAPFQERLTKWRATLDEIQQEPFGHGLGAGNPNAIPHRFADIANQEIDNSYLMIAYDQGLAVLVLFAAGMLVLLTELLRHALWTRAPGGSVMAAAAAGTLVAMLAEFMANDFIYAPPVVAGWMVVGLGVAQFGTPRRHQAPEAQAARAPAFAS